MKILNIFSEPGLFLVGLAVVFSFLLLVGFAICFFLLILIIRDERTKHKGEIRQIGEKVDKVYFRQEQVLSSAFSNLNKDKVRHEPSKI